MSDRSRVWIVDDDRSIRWVLSRALERDGLTPRTFETANLALAAMERERPDVLVTDIRMPGMGGMELLRAVRETAEDLPVIVITAHSDLDAAVSAYEGGAFEYLPKPFDVDEAVALVQRALAARRESAANAAHRGEVPEILGEAPAMQEVFRAIGRLSHSHITVLINGESGTGKERVARALHQHSPRAGKPFIALNMAAIPKDLIESELFGHEKGAFTGATAQRQGRFEQADGGTLFLDEIGDMPAETQTRLLRVLADGEFYRVGAHTPSRVDVRIIAATHQDLSRQVAEGRFREDLFHRLNVIRIHVPPLRERPQDLEILVGHFLTELNRQLGLRCAPVDAAVLEMLQKYPWPGNVRELRNMLKRIMILEQPPRLQADHFPDHVRHGRNPRGAERADTGLSLMPLAETEKRQILFTLEQTGNNKSRAARILGISRQTLREKLRVYEATEGGELKADAAEG